MSTITTRKSIKVSKETYDILSKRGTVADSFEDVIRRLLNEKKETAMTTSTVSFSVEDPSIMKKIKAHLSTCDCCRKAIAEGITDK